MCLLLVEGSAPLRESLAAEFRRAGHEIEPVGDVPGAFEAAKRKRHDVIVLDVAETEEDWPELLQRLRAEGAGANILLLTPGDSVDDRVRGLNSGADDCVSRPFSFEELLARVRALLRSRRRVRSSEIRIDDLVIETEARRVKRAGFAVRLTRREFMILEYLAQRRGQLVSQTELEDHLYGAYDPPMSNAVASAICLLRKKLGDPGRKSGLLQTRRGQGYRLGSPVAG